MSTDRFGEPPGDKRGADRADAAVGIAINPSPLDRARVFVAALQQQADESEDPLGFLRGDADGLKRIAYGCGLVTSPLGHRDAPGGGTFDIFAAGPGGLDWQGLVTVETNGKDALAASLWVLDQPPVAA